MNEHKISTDNNLSENTQIEKAKAILSSENNTRQKAGFDILQKLADDGHPEALFLVGQCYYHGIGTNKNLVNAEDYLQEASNSGHSEAKLLLGKIYATSTNNIRRRKMLRLFQESAEAGIPEAIYLYAVQLLKQNIDDDAAVELMYDAADKQYPSAQTFIGLNEELRGNFQKACDYYEKAAQNNDTIGLRILANRYMYNEISSKKVIKDETLSYDEQIYEMQRKAYNYYKQSANNGDLESQFRCAIFKRDGIYKDHAAPIEEAIEELFLSAKYYYKPALECLKKLSENNKFNKYFRSDGPRLLQWLDERQVCAQADAIFGTEEAYQIYDSLAANNGYAQYKKAICLYFGYGVRQNAGEAINILIDITNKPHTKHNALAHYFLSYYYLLIRVKEIESKNRQSASEKEATIAKYHEMALKSHRIALNNIGTVFRSKDDFYKAVKDELHAEELDTKIAALTNKYNLDNNTEENNDIDEEALMSISQRQKLFTKFLGSLKKRMKYEIISSSTYSKYCSGDRGTNYNVLRSIALDASLSVAECRHMFELAGQTFSPLTVTDDYRLKLVLSGEYVQKLTKEELDKIAKFEKSEVVKEFIFKNKKGEEDYVKSKLQAILIIVDQHFTTLLLKKKGLILPQLNK